MLGTNGAVGAVSDLGVLGAWPRLSLEIFVPRSEEGVSELCEPLLRELAAFGPAFVGLSGYDLGSVSPGARIAAFAQGHALRLQLHLTCAGTSQARAAWLVDECVRAGVRDVLLLPGDAAGAPASQGTAAAAPAAHGFGSLLELLRFVKQRAGSALRCAVPGYPHGSTGELGDYFGDVQQLRLQLRAGAEVVLCQPVYEPGAVAALAADLGDDLRGVTLAATLLPLQSKTEVARLVRGLGLSLPAWLRARLESAPNDEAVRTLGDETLARLAAGLRGLRMPGGAALGLHVATLNAADSPALLRAAGFAPLCHRTNGPGIVPPSRGGGRGNPLTRAGAAG